MVTVSFSMHPSDPSKYLRLRVFVASNLVKAMDSKSHLYSWPQYFDLNVVALSHLSDLTKLLYPSLYQMQLM